MGEKEGLREKSKPVGKAEERRTDNYPGRAGRDKRVSNEEIVVEAKGAGNEPTVAKMAVRPKKLRMREVPAVTKPVTVEMGTSKP